MNRMRRLQREEAVYGYLFLMPGLAFIIVFLLVPIVQTALYSFTDISFFSIKWELTGLENFREMLMDTRFLRAGKNTLFFALIVVPCRTLVSLVVAVLVTKLGRRSGSFFRTVFFIPVITSLPIIALIWRYIYLPDVGLANSVFEMLGLSRSQFLGDRNIAMICIIVFYIWKNFGWDMVIIISGILGISPDLFETGKIDGTNALTEFFHITLPLIRRSMVFVLVMATMNALKIFTPVYLMTGGGPVESTEVAIHYIYNKAFSNGELGYASALSMATIVVIMLFSSAQFLITNRDD